MPGPRPYSLKIAPPVRRELEALAHGGKVPHWLAIRAKIVLSSEGGTSIPDVAAIAGCDERSVRKWRRRFANDPRIDALRDRPRTGRPTRVPVDARCAVVKIACTRPADKQEAPFRDVWTYRTLGDQLFAELGVRLSTSEIGRILRANELQPHRMRPWLHSPDPEFQPKVRRICNLYLDPPPGAAVVCVDEKTSIQALSRKHATKPAAPRRVGKFEFEYVRHGTRSLIAGFDVRTGQVFGQCRERRTAQDLLEFMEALAKRYPTGPVYVIWDNLNIHSGEQWRLFNERHGGRFHFVYTPLHASWVNQVEVWFGILQRRILRFGEFESTDALAARILAFIEHWNTHEAHPFRWTFRGRFQHHPGERAA